MQLDDKQIFIKEFFQFQNPKPMETIFSEQEVKNNDMKISLEIATRSYLRMQSDPKTNLVSFSCKNYGKNCFEIFGIKNDGFYMIQTDYKMVQHQRLCQLRHQFYEYLKIYNLMKLKKSLIESYMVKKELFNSSPSQILSQISQQNEYFFEKNINYNPEMRRKLRKRFDNIINIDIKKITKGGRDQRNEKNGSQVLKQKKNQNRSEKNSQQEWSEGQKDQTSFYNLKKSKKSKLVRKKPETKAKKSIVSKVKDQSQKQNICITKKESQGKSPLDEMDDQIYVNPASESELKQIKELNEEFNGFQDVFSYQSDDPYQPVYPETINDKLRQSVFLSLRNSMLKKSLQTQSLSNFPENIGNINDFNEQDQIV